MSGSAKAGTTAERHTGVPRILECFHLRALTGARQENCVFLLTKTYMEVGKQEVAGLTEHGLPFIRLRRLIRLAEKNMFLYCSSIIEAIFVSH